MPRNISYNGRVFRSVSNTTNGEVSSETLFSYRHENAIVWATYAGGGISFGTLIAVVNDDDSLEMRYQHVNAQGELMTGRCRSVPEMLSDGRIRLHESWQWTCGDCSSGQSVVEEVKPLERDNKLTDEQFGS
jgi:hypothetical protein